MKRIIALTLIFTTTLSYPCYAKPQYSEATKKLMQEAGQVIDYDVNEVMARQEARRQAQANKSTPTTKNTQETASRGSQTASRYGAKFSNDEFHTAPVDIDANDGYGAGGFDELHINENFRQNVWQPDYEVSRINGFDEFKLPNEM